MNYTSQIIITSILQAFHELRANKLRTFLSLLGITIGIFCIIAVLTVLDSMKNNIQKEMSTLGSDVLYVGRWPWMDEGGEYKWWEFWRRPSMTPTELKAVESQIKDVDFATLSFTNRNVTLKHQDLEISSITGYAVTSFFDKIQNIEIAGGRYLSSSELSGSSNTVVIGDEVYNELFPGHTNAIGKTITFLGRQFIVIGVMKKTGQNMAGFDFDNSIIYPYYTAASIMDVRSLNNEPILLIKAATGKNIDEVKYEVEGVLRRVRKVRPGQGNDFAINQLSQVSERLDLVFTSINMIGSIIGGFSLIVGAFGIANIMFVTVKERTKIIGLKKAIGARQSSILMEFLIEAITLCIAGGIIGIILVLILSLVLTYAADFAVTLSIKNFLTGISISAVVGVLAGFIPARSASKLDRWWLYVQIKAMNKQRLLILDEERISWKLRRMAFEIWEKNSNEEGVSFIGIEGSGMAVARSLAAILKEISPLEVNVINMKLNKRKPSKDIDIDQKVLKPSIVLVDDVANSGKTLAYALKPILDFDAKKILIAVLVDRKHKSFPVSPDIVGHSVASTLQEHIEVETDGDRITAAYLQ